MHSIAGGAGLSNYILGFSLGWKGGGREEGGRRGVGVDGVEGEEGHEVWEVFTLRMKIWFSQKMKTISTENMFGSADQPNEHRMTSPQREHYTEMPR